LEIGNWKLENKLNSEIARGTVKEEEFLLAKPQLYMNESGRAVAQVVRSQKSEVRDLIIIHDDLDIRLGEYKIQKGKGPKLHNGIESIENALGTKDFWRIRIGVDNRTSDNRIPGESYVLQNFTADEIENLNNTFEKILPEMLNLLHE
jgi:PTH1 family peptidyl-tRNA hydrolase